MLKFRTHIILVSCILLAASCAGLDDEFLMPRNQNIREGGERGASEETRNVMLLYSAGYNTLSSYLTDDIRTLTEKGFIPGRKRNDNVLLVFSHLTAKYSDYVTRTSPVLFRLYKDRDGKTVSDTLKIFPKSTLSVSSLTVTEVMNYIRDEFPARGYGMVFSSHATGWLPAGVYSESSRTKPTSVGQYQGASGEYCYEMDLRNFAKAFPYKLDYILFDACLMGGIEVAWQLRDVTDYVGFSQTEVMADGYQYELLAQDLIGGPESDPEAVCRHYFEQYEKSGGGATVSLVKTSEIPALATVCKSIWENHREDLRRVDADEVQAYFRFGKSWYYDLRDLVGHLNPSEGEMKALDAALSGCVKYKANTKSFLGISLKNCCGLSTYIQKMGDPSLDDYYRTLDWDIATDYIE